VGTVIGRFEVRIRTAPGCAPRKLDTCTTEMHTVWFTGMEYAELLSHQPGNLRSRDAVLRFARTQTAMSSVSAAKLLVEAEDVPQHIRDLAREYAEAALRLGAAIDSEAKAPETSVRSSTE